MSRRAFYGECTVYEELSGPSSALSKGLAREIAGINWPGTEIEKGWPCMDGRQT